MKTKGSYVTSLFFEVKREITLLKFRAMLNHTFSDVEAENIRWLIIYEDLVL